MKRLLNLLLCSLLVALWFEFAFVPTASAHNCLENIQAYVANPTAPAQGMIEDCMRTGYAQALITAIIALIAAGLISRELGQTLIEKVQDQTQKKDCRDRMKLVQDAAAEYRRYDQVISNILSEIDAIRQGRDVVAKCQAEVDAAEADYQKCVKWWATLAGIGAPVGWIGPRLFNWGLGGGSGTISGLASVRSNYLAYLAKSSPTVFGLTAAPDVVELASFWGAISNVATFLGLFAFAIGIADYEASEAKNYLDQTQNSLLQGRLELSKASMSLNLKENGLKARSDPILLADQKSRWSNIHSLWYKLLPDCTDEWSRLHGVLGGEQLSNLPSTRGLAPGWQQMTLDQIQATVQ